jgi:cell division protease FtsH
MSSEDFDPNENDTLPDAAETAEPPPDAAAMAAREMVLGIIADQAVLTAARAKGAVVVVVSPAPEWSEDLCDAWQSLVLERKPTQPRGRYGRAKWLHVLRPKDDRARIARQDDDQTLSQAVEGGYGALLVSHDLGALTPTETAAADIIVHVPRLSEAQLLALSAKIGKDAPPPMDVAMLVGATPPALRLSTRPGQTSVEFLDRLGAFLAAIGGSKVSAQKPASQGLKGLHGMDQAVAWGFGLADDIGAYGRGEIPWSSVPPGCLLSGPPGVGKSTYAYRLASECQVPLVITSYSEWQSAGREGHLGELLKCLRDRFAEARKLAPSILFIDELDSVQNRNIGGSDNTNAWFTAIINALLFEFGNPQSLTGVVVVGASNYASKVDEALRRAGRLDVEIKIPRPGLSDLKSILSGLVNGDLVADLLPVAQRLQGGTGADAEKAVRGARARARRAGRSLTVDDLMAEVGGAGGRKASRRTAVHEAGHAVVVAATRPQDIVSLSVQQTDSYMGGLLMCEGNGHASTSDGIKALLCEMLSGRAAEEVVCGHVSGGSGGSTQSDLARATLLAVSADLSWGMGKTLTWHGDMSAQEAGRLVMMRADIAGRVEARLASAYSETLRMIRDRRRAVEVLSDALLAREVMSGDQVREVLSSVAASAPKVRSAPAVRLELADDDEAPAEQYGLRP